MALSHVNQPNQRWYCVINVWKIVRNAFVTYTYLSIQSFVLWKPRWVYAIFMEKFIQIFRSWRMFFMLKWVYRVLWHDKKSNYADTFAVISYPGYLTRNRCSLKVNINRPRTSIWTRIYFILKCKKKIRFGESGNYFNIFFT